MTTTDETLTGVSLPDAVLTVSAEVNAWAGMGPLYLREVLATAVEGDVRFDITRVMPLGLHVSARRGDEVVTLVVNERVLIEAVCAMARDRLPRAEG